MKNIKNIRNNLLRQVVKNYANDLLIDSNEIVDVLNLKNSLLDKLKDTFSFLIELENFEMRSNYVIVGLIKYQLENGDLQDLSFTITYMDGYEDKNGCFRFKWRKPNKELYEKTL